MPEPEAGVSNAAPDAAAGAAGPEPAQPDPRPFEPELALAREGLAFAEALVEVAGAEFKLSAEAAARAAGLGIAAILALLVAWLLGTIAAIFALHAWLDSAALAFAIVALLHAFGAALALRQRRLWHARMGFERTRGAIAAALAEPGKQQP